MTASSYPEEDFEGGFEDDLEEDFNDDSED